MDSKEMLDILELAVAARSPLAPLDANKASRALLGLLDPGETEEAYETAASTHEGAEVFSEAADHLASLEKLSDAEVRAAILDGGTRSIVAQALSEVREAYNLDGPNPSLIGIWNAVQSARISLQQARAALSLHIPRQNALARSQSESIHFTVDDRTIRFGEPVTGPKQLFLPNGILIGQVGAGESVSHFDLGPRAILLSEFTVEGGVLSAL